MCEDWAEADAVFVRLRAREIIRYGLEDVGIASGGVVKPRGIDQGDSPLIEEKCGRFHVDGATFKRITDGQV